MVAPGKNLFPWCISVLGLHNKIPPTGDLNNRNVLSHSSRNQKPGSKIFTRLVPSGSSEWESLLCPSHGFWWLWASLVVLGLGLHNPNLCLHLHVAFFPLWVPESSFLSLIRLVIGFSAHPKSRKTSSRDPQLSPSVKTFFFGKLYSQVLRVKTWTCLLWNMSQPITDSTP